MELSLVPNQIKVVSQPKMEEKGRRKLVPTTKAIGDLKIHIRLWGVSRKKVNPSSESSYMTTQTRFARFRGHIRTFTLGIYFFSTHSPEFNNIYYHTGSMSTNRTGCMSTTFSKK